MRVSRIYLAIDHNSLDKQWVIEQSKAHYIRNVLRLKPGQALRFFTATGREFEATISIINKHEVVIDNIKPCTEAAPVSRLNTTLVQAISSSDRMDYSVQKSAELGCQVLQPVITDFCAQRIAKHKYDKKLQHWQAVAISACEQSGRADIMTVKAIKSLNEVIDTTAQGIYFEPTADKHLHDTPVTMQQTQTLFVGPEGGFSPQELDRFVQAGYLGVCLGQRVLRTETMAPVALSALHTLFGDFTPVRQ